MKEKEKQRKFHEALLKMMYPIPTPLPRHEDEVQEDEVEHKFLDLPEEEELENETTYSSSPSGTGTDDKLSRAQRKRLRKRKLKESASKRRAIIGPLLPDSNDVIASGVPEGVRQNAATKVSGEPPGCSSKRNKLKQRRKSKNSHGIGSEEAE